jgi:hypothetical protein
MPCCPRWNALLAYLAEAVLVDELLDPLEQGSKDIIKASTFRSMLIVTLLLERVSAPSAGRPSRRVKDGARALAARSSRDPSARHAELSSHRLLPRSSPYPAFSVTNLAPCKWPAPM